MDWPSRKVLAWRLSSTMEAAFCVDALEEAMERHGKPDISNSDQGAPFTSFGFTQKLKAAGIRISMDGKGRWLDNVFVERLWRSLKYECVYLNARSGGREARDGIVPGSPSTISAARILPMMDGHQMLPITKLTQRCLSRWRRNITNENRTSRSDL